MLSMDLFIGKKFVDHISVVLFHNDHRLNLLAVSIVQLICALFDHLDKGLDLLLVQISQFLERIVGPLLVLG